MKKRIAPITIFFALFVFNFCIAAPMSPDVLIVIAHPDDENVCAATVYKITHELRGHVDMVVITNGEGGYKYSTLAEDYYQLELTDEKIGRENLPRIRKQELMNAGKILGVRNYFFLDQWDRKYTTDERDPLDTAWDVALIKKRIPEILKKGNYDFVFCLLPVPETHGHHKAATMLALEAVSQFPKEHRPVILGVMDSEKRDSVGRGFIQLKDYITTSINKSVANFVLDRTTKFGYKNALDYKIIVNWEIAEHKSQGTVQLNMNRDNFENFFYFNINNESGIEKTKLLFEELKKIPYQPKTY